MSVKESFGKNNMGVFTMLMGRCFFLTSGGEKKFGDDQLRAVSGRIVEDSNWNSP